MKQTSPWLTPMSVTTKKPTAEPSQAGWLLQENRQGLATLLTPTTQWILEVGSFHGLSARYMLELAPNASIVCVDAWAGTDLGGGSVADYDVFRASCWDYADRIVPIMADSRQALPRLLQLGFRPDLIYIDGAHTFEVVVDDLMNAFEFPGAIVCGDDFAPEWPEVVQAVTSVSLKTGRRFRELGRFFCFGQNRAETLWQKTKRFLRTLP